MFFVVKSNQDGVSAKTQEWGDNFFSVCIEIQPWNTEFWEKENNNKGFTIRPSEHRYDNISRTILLLLFQPQTI